MTTRRARALVLAGAALAAAMIAAAVAACATAGLTWQQALDDYEVTNVVIGASFVLCGAVIAWFVHRNPVGWLFVVAGLLHLVTASLLPGALLAVRSGAPSLPVDWVALLAGQAWGFGVTGLFLVALLVFPDGRLPGLAGRVVLALIAVSDVGQLLEGVLAPGPVLPGQSEGSPVALPDPAPDWVLNVLNLVGGLAALGVVGALVARYVRGDDRVRRQLLWLILALIAILVLNLQRFVTGSGPIPLLLTFVLVPAAIAIAIVRHGLLDIRLVVSRTLTYGVLLVLVTALFAGLVAGLDLVLPLGGQRGASIVAAIAVAIAFAPLRSLLLRTVGRALYGRRSDPAAIATRLGSQLAAPSDSLEQALALIRAELRLPYLAIGAAEDAALAESGSPSEGTAVLPLVDGTALRVGLRRGERTLHPADRRALELLAVPLAVARRALVLSAAVAEARTAVVTEREHERQRLQRELHDGLGPRLTGVAFRLDAAANTVARDPSGAADLLAESRADLRQAIATVREVVHDLRPIELDEGGLVPALRSRIEELAGSAPIVVRFVLVDPLPPASAAVEVAVYRVALEAVTNAVRHSRGSVCTVALSADGAHIVLHVDDDGPIPPRWTPGVGIASMRHRAAEVGGVLEAGPSGTGWAVRARLPARPAIPGSGERGS